MAITYAIDGGADATKFNINATSGALTFKVAPDFEAPGDANADNIYEVSVKATDAGGLSSSKLVKVTVIDVSEGSPPQITSAGAVTVKENATTVMTVTATDPDDTTQPPIEPPIEPPAAGGAWPDASNRPSISGSTLTWTDAAGARQTRALTASGGITTTTAGQIIEGKDITGPVKLNHDNCIMRQCRIRHTQGSGCIIDMMGHNVIVEDCLITKNGGTHQNGVNVHWSSGASSKPNFLRRCNIYGFENHVPSTTRCTIEDNWFHGAVGPDCDMVELNGGAQSTGSNDSVIIRHNTFDGRDRSGFLNAGVNLTSWQGPVTNITIDNNCFLQGGNSHDICDDTSQGSGAVSFSVTKNGFWNSGGAKRGSAATITANKENFTMATATATSGALINGTGVI